MTPGAGAKNNKTKLIASVASNRATDQSNSATEFIVSLG
jgi:hypothetical protein